MVVERVEPVTAVQFSQWRDRWVQLVSRSPDAFLEVDGSGVVIEWNPRAEEMFGWGREEVVGRPVGETLMPKGLTPSPFLPSAVTGEDHRVRPEPGIAEGDRQRFELVNRAGHTVSAE